MMFVFFLVLKCLVMSYLREPVYRPFLKSYASTIFENLFNTRLVLEYKNVSFVVSKNKFFISIVLCCLD